MAAAGVCFFSRNAMQETAPDIDDKKVFHGLHLDIQDPLDQ